MNTTPMKYLCILFSFVCFLLATTVHAEEADDDAPATVVPAGKKVRNDHGFKNNDGEWYNKRHGLILHLGPPGFQGGQPNPVGIPPSVPDIEFTYLHPTGFEGNFGIVPGITGGVRYRTGNIFYGSAGGGIIISGTGVGPGFYTGMGMSLMRQWPFTIEFEAKQAIGFVFDKKSVYVTVPFALRIGAGYYF